MKKIYYLQKHEVKLGDIVEYNGIKTVVTEELIELNPELFIVKDSIQELLNKAKRDYPAGTVFRSLFGGIYTVKNKPCYRLGAHSSILIDNTYVYRDGRWVEVLPLKFTTEDGVDIYGDMKTFLIHPNDNVDIFFNHSSWNGDSCLKGYKYFYHKENALAYIKKHKEKTLEDYENSLSLSVWGWFKIHEPKLYYTKILQLIADDLNDDWEPDFNNERQKKWFIDTLGVKAHCSVNYGLMYFKSRELAEKARVILGDKLSVYLIN